jgi:Permuted papain-like amidase enzyme, YaeF/YiiX, C92 family
VSQFNRPKGKPSETRLVNTGCDILERNDCGSATIPDNSSTSGFSRHRSARIALDHNGMKRLPRWSLGLSATCAAALGVFAVWLSLTAVAATVLPPLKTGDIVFQESGNSQSLAIALGSGSLYTHTGLIEISTDGRINVVEATGPVRTTPLDKWIEHGTGGRITIKRVKGLEADAAQKTLAAAHSHDGKPYDHFFYKGRDAIYCSELVHLAFKDGAGLAIGAEQRVKDLNIDNAAVRSLIEERWRQYPVCVAKNATSFEDCYPMILDETLVTPASVARDAKLETVFTNFGAAAD